MNPTEWQKIKDLFNATFDLPESERAGFLAERDEDLCREVEKLIKADEEAADFIVEPALVDIGLVEENETDFYVGKQIDSYKILKEIGRGGMGTVYLASRGDESFDKIFAVKLISRGMDTTAVLKRFVMERRILARLEHPNIAQLLDGGSTTDGLPYFVMEYVEGLPITKFCDSHEFSTGERLELFQKVCSAVSYAHQNLVVHRDIKPSNILVTEDGSAKLLDFGIAKLLHPEWSLDTTEATATMFRLMTPEYASPEQIRGLPVTTASDVYSLGVVLYELLSGQRPFKIESRLPEEAAQIVLTAEPLRPSLVVLSHSLVDDKRATQSNAQRTKDEGQRTKSLKGDLDNIVLKALRKEPTRRYNSVQEFSEDIRRHLAGLPVTATADTSFYRFNKFIKRHRAGVFASLLIAVILLSATVITSWQAVVAKREQAKAEMRFNQVRKLANAVLFEYHDDIKKLAGSTPIREKMVKDALEYLDNLSAENTNDADLQRELAAAYEKVGDVQSGDDSFGSLNQSRNSLLSYQKALKIREKISADFPQNSDDLYNLAVCYRQVGDGLGVGGNFPARLENYQKAIKIHEELAETNPLNEKFQYGFASGLYDLGFASDQTSNNGNAILNYSKAIEIWQNLLNNNQSNAEFSRKLSKAYKFLGRVLEREKRNEEAIGNYQKSLSLDEARVAFDDVDAQAKLDLSASYMVFANLFLKTGNIKSAEEFCRQGLEIRKAVAKTDPSNTDALTLLARAYNTSGEIEQKNRNLPGAIGNYQLAITIFTQPQNIDNSDFVSNNYLADFYKNLAVAYEESSAETISTANKRQNLLKAKENYQKAFEVVKILQEHNTLTSRTSAKPDEISQKINACETALAKLQR
ncbi:MAG: protein kinase domain-containing protein [Pyrinomonadaceae bacterium]